MFTPDGAKRQSALIENQLKKERVGRMYFPVRGRIVPNGVHHVDHPSGIEQTVVDLYLYDQYPPLYNVPMAATKMNRENGEAWTPEAGDVVLVEFINGNFEDPIVTWQVPGPHNEIQEKTADAPSYHRKRSGTWERIGKDGTRSVHVALNDLLEVVQDLTVTVLNGITRIISKGKILLQSEDKVELDGNGGEGTLGGVLQEHHRCQFHGKPFNQRGTAGNHFSSTVKASKE